MGGGVFMFAVPGWLAILVLLLLVLGGSKLVKLLLMTRYGFNQEGAATRFYGPQPK